MLEVFIFKVQPSGKFSLLRYLPTRVDEQYLYFAKDKIPRNGLTWRTFEDFDEARAHLLGALKERLRFLKEQQVMTEQSLLKLDMVGIDDIPIAHPSGKRKL